MIYFVTTAILIVTVAVCFYLGRSGVVGFGWKQWALRVLVAMPLLGSGALHFARVSMYASIIPPPFPWRTQLVLLSGVLEIAGAVGLFLPAVSRAASACLSLLMIAIFPANVYVANHVVGGMHMPSVPVRTAMQVVYIVLLLLAGWGVPSANRRSLGFARDDKG